MTPEEYDAQRRVDELRLGLDELRARMYAEHGGYESKAAADAVDAAMDQALRGELAGSAAGQPEPKRGDPFVGWSRRPVRKR